MTMLTRSSFRLIALALAVLVAGCSYLPETKKIDYGSATKAPPLDIPPDLTKPGNNTQYSAPNVAVTGTAVFSEINAKNVAAQNKKNDGTVLPDGTRGVARVERQGNQRWLVVSVPEDKAWNVTKAFWQENGFILKSENPQTGVMETDWAENRANVTGSAIQGFLGKVIGTLYSTPERDMYRTRLEKSATPGVTEIYISHRGMEEVYINEGKDQTRWQPRPADPTLEAEMLRRLMLKFDGVTEDQAKQMEQQVDGKAPADKAHIVKAPDGAAMLVVDDSFDRAWRRVGLALDRVGFTVEDRERSEGLYYVRYVDSDEKSVQEKDGGGFWSKLAFWRSSDDKVPKKVQYRIRIREEQSGGPSDVVVLVSGDSGQADVSPVARQILDLLLQQLR